MCRAARSVTLTAMPVSRRTFIASTVAAAGIASTVPPAAGGDRQARNRNNASPDDPLGIRRRILRERQQIRGVGGFTR